MSLVDLSVIINEDTPVYPGDPKTKIEPAGILEKDGYEDHYVSVGTHVGTHIDAPSHMVLKGKTLDKISVDRFSGKGIYIQVDKKFELEEIKKVDIKQDDIVLFHTGMSDVYYQPAYYENYPVITEEIANYLVEKKIKMVGVDMCSVDHEPFPAHRVLLKNDIYIIENLTNLETLKGKEFTIYAFPLKLQIDGSPARVVAEVL
ncbi:MAG: cyclase family protein [Candidatus Colwellbacteria bacterium]|nr:cyclase family protein [Candidatus Colwellbacteria bacterium]